MQLFCHTNNLQSTSKTKGTLVFIFDPSNRQHGESTNLKLKKVKHIRAYNDMKKILFRI